jgi:hypothetical protein
MPHARNRSSADPRVPWPSPRRSGGAQASIRTSQVEIAEQRCGAGIKNEMSIAPGFLCQARSQKGFAHACWPDDEHILVPLDSTGVVGQRAHPRAVESARSAIVDVLRRRRCLAAWPNAAAVPGRSSAARSTGAAPSGRVFSRNSVAAHSRPARSRARSRPSRPDAWPEVFRL